MLLVTPTHNTIVQHDYYDKKCFIMLCYAMLCLTLFHFIILASTSTNMRNHSSIHRMKLMIIHPGKNHSSAVHSREPFRHSSFVPVNTSNADSKFKMVPILIARKDRYRDMRTHIHIHSKDPLMPFTKLSVDRV